MSVKITCASGNHTDTNKWHDIDWKHAHRKVKKLQVRIANATKEGRYNKVKSLQWILTHSYSAKVIAVKRVTETQGKSTPGVDGIVWSTPEMKITAAKELKRRGYRPLPLRRIYIPKKNGKKRALHINPKWEEYSEKRFCKLQMKHIKHRKRLLNVWKAQNGKCPCCEERITVESGWNLHHIVKRISGGTENLSNLKLLHPNCHRQVHYGWKVAGSRQRV